MNPVTIVCNIAVVQDLHINLLRFRSNTPDTSKGPQFGVIKSSYKINSL